MTRSSASVTLHLAPSARGSDLVQADPRWEHRSGPLALGVEAASKTPPHRRALAIPTGARSTKRTPHGCSQWGFDRPRLGGRVVPVADAFCSPLGVGQHPKTAPRRHTALPASLFLLLKGCTVAIFRRLLLAAGRARAVRASARARLVRSNEYCRPAASRLPDGSTRLAMRAPAALAAAPAAAALAAAALAGKRYDRRRPLHPRLPSRAPSRRARPTLLAHGTRRHSAAENRRCSARSARDLVLSRLDPAIPRVYL